MRQLSSAPLLIGLALCLGACSHVPKPPPPLSPVERESAAISAFLAGRIAETGSQSAEAARRYSDSLELLPDQPFLQDRALLAALGAGDVEHALRAASLASSEQRSALAGLVLGADLFARGKEDDARKILAGLAGDPLERTAAVLLEAWSYAAQGRHEEALTALDSLDFRIGAAGLSGLAGDQRALLLLHARKPRDAAANLPGGAGSQQRLRGVELRIAQVLQSVGRVEEAQAILSADRDSEDPRLAEAAAGLGRGRVRWPALSAREGAAQGIASFGAAFAGAQPSEHFLPFLTLALIANPDADDLRLLQSQVLRAAGRTPAALGALDAIGPKSPYAMAASVERARLLQAAGRTEEAIALAQAAAASGAPFALAAMADLYRLSERWADAEVVYARLFEATPEPDWRLYFLRGMVRERLGRWREAELDLREALALEPEQADILNYLGYGWVERGERLQEAVSLLEKAVRLQPRAGYIIDSLGWAYFKVGDLEAAQTELERAAEIAPEDPAVNDHLGDLYAKLGRDREARFQWERALSLTGEAALRASLEAKLGRGGATETSPQATPQ